MAKVKGAGPNTSIPSKQCTAQRKGKEAVGSLQCVVLHVAVMVVAEMEGWGTVTMTYSNSMI